MSGSLAAAVSLGTTGARLGFQAGESVHERNADRERSAGHAKEEPEHQKERVRPQRSRKGNQQHGNCRGPGEHGEHDSAAIAVGEGSDGHPAERADQNWHGDKESCLRGTQPEFAAVADAERRDDVPRPESDREANECQCQVLGLTRLQGRVTCSRAGHELSSPSQVSGVRSRVPTGAQPRWVGAAPGAGRSSRLR